MSSPVQYYPPSPPHEGAASRTYGNVSGGAVSGFPPPPSQPQNIPSPVGMAASGHHSNYNPHSHHNQQPHHHGNASVSPPSQRTSQTSSSIDPESKYSGGSTSSHHRPPSAQSAGYRLAGSLGGPEPDAEGYLAPRSSAGSSYQGQQYTNHNVTGPISQHQHPPHQQQHTHTGNNVISREHDSGVDIDRHSHHDSHSNSSDLSKNSISFHPNGAIGWGASNDHKSAPEKAARPDSIAFKSHDYEELPLKKELYSYADVDDHNRSNAMATPQKHGSQDTLAGSGTPHRRRQNPLYDAALRQDSKGSGSKSSGSGSAGCTRCLCVSIIVIATLAGLALILSLVAMSGVARFTTDPYNDGSTRTVYTLSTPSSAQLQLALERIEELEARYNALLDKIKLLETSSDVAALISNVSQQTERVAQLSGSVSQVQTGLDDFRVQVASDLDAISRQPGPQGPPGAGNLTACETKVSSKGGTGMIQGNWIDPSANNAFVTLGMECSGEEIEFSFLEKRDKTSGTPGEEFHCVCQARVGVSAAYCELHYWRCPRIS